LFAAAGAELCYVRRGGEGLLAELASAAPGFAGESTPLADGRRLTLAPPTAENLAALRMRVPHLQPRVLGLARSAGCGDRLGLATPGHVRALRGSGFAAILAQQSVRENVRTGRSPQQVLGDAVWGAFREGWREGFGADADHLKTPADIDAFAAAGYTFFTIDPGEHVDGAADTAAGTELVRRLPELPWAELETSWDDVRRSVPAPEEDLARAAVKYARVAAHVSAMYRRLAAVMSGRPFEMEISVDETATATSPAEHAFLAHVLRRLGVRWVSLAPRYAGSFEKGVDYAGDLAEFAQHFAAHERVQREYGPYKLSLHSGSDKFAIYPVVAQIAGARVHLKTAGTSYLEALRVISEHDAPLFGMIVALARRRYPQDRATYHVSAELEKMPAANALDNFHARQVLHVTFGSVLQDPELGPRLREALARLEDAYHAAVERHFRKHFTAFGGAA
jgi:hypothetical protein